MPEVPPEGWADVPSNLELLQGIEGSRAFVMDREGVITSVQNGHGGRCTLIFDRDELVGQKCLDIRPQDAVDKLPNGRIRVIVHLDPTDDPWIIHIVPAWQDDVSPYESLRRDPYHQLSSPSDDGFDLSAPNSFRMAPDDHAEELRKIFEKKSAVAAGMAVVLVWVGVVGGAYYLFNIKGKPNNPPAVQKPVAEPESNIIIPERPPIPEEH